MPATTCRLAPENARFPACAGIISACFNFKTRHGPARFTKRNETTARADDALSLSLSNFVTSSTTPRFFSRAGPAGNYEIADDLRRDPGLSAPET